jgi:exosortase A-associated hydrolase 2
VTIVDDQLNVKLEPFYLESPSGSVFCLLTAIPEADLKEIWIYLPPFAEEANRCRAMAAMQSRMLSKYGVGVLLVDYFGTGDSAGDFSETSWNGWKQDIQAAIKWVREKQGQAVKIRLWGIRLGAVLAAEIADENREEINHLVFWQPVVDAKLIMTQFLRVRVASAMDRGEPKTTTKEIRQKFEEGEGIEIAGYHLSANLALEIDRKRLKNYTNLSGASIDWFELANEQTNELSIPSQKLIENWEKEGVSIKTHKFTGPAFWQLHEREMTLDLISKMDEMFGQENE